jgi:osmoprotectant transport system permease protein
MEFVSAVIAWFADPANWMGRNGIPNRLFEHLAISAVSLGIALLIALPIGTYIGHTGRGAVVAISLTNIGRAIPSLGIIGIALPIALALHVASGFWSTVIALTALAIPPIVLNTYSGLHAVSRDLLEAGRGMGMRERQLLRRVEIPLALPIILAGVRISAVQVVATATLALVVGGGTLGTLIYVGIQTRNLPQIFASALMVALLAILTEGTFALIQRAAASRAPQRGTRLRPPLMASGRPEL